MGSESTAEGDVLVVSDFSAGRLLKIDVSDPANMVATTLVSNTGTTPNGITVKDGVATVVNWYGNADILQVDLATGELTTLVDGTGLGNCDGVDWANGSLIVSSWNPQRITRFSPDPDIPGEWTAETVVQGNPTQQPCRLEREHRWRPLCRGVQRQQHSLLWRARIPFQPSPHHAPRCRRFPPSRGCRAGSRTGRDMDSSWVGLDRAFVGHHLRIASRCRRCHLDMGPTRRLGCRRGPVGHSIHSCPRRCLLLANHAEARSLALRRLRGVVSLYAGSTSTLTRNRFHRASALNSSRSACKSGRYCEGGKLRSNFKVI